MSWHDAMWLGLMVVVVALFIWAAWDDPNNLSNPNNWWF